MASNSWDIIKWEPFDNQQWLGSHPWGSRKINFLVDRNRSWCWHFWLLWWSLWLEQTSVFTLSLLERVVVLFQVRETIIVRDVRNYETRNRDSLSLVIRILANIFGRLIFWHLLSHFRQISDNNFGHFAGTSSVEMLMTTYKMINQSILSLWATKFSKLALKENLYSLFATGKVYHKF